MLGQGRRCKSSAVAFVLGALAITLAGCVLREPDVSASPPTEPPIDADTAKQQMIDAIDDVTKHLGGVWKPRTGPDAPEHCELPDGTQGAHWVYLTGRTSRGGSQDPESDAKATLARWKSQGMKVERWTDPDGPAIVGRGGGSIDSINLYAFPGNYTVEAISLCFPGDADEL